jgi:hypothetical protein
MIEEIQRRCRPEVDQLDRAESTQTPKNQAKLLILWHSRRESNPSFQIEKSRGSSNDFKRRVDSSCNVPVMEDQQLTSQST